MKMLKVVSTLACLAALAVSPAAGQAPAPAAAAVTVQQASVEDPGHPPITVAIFSPASAAPTPLIVISHGTGGGAISHLDTAKALAEAGFVVAAPMHPGDNFQDDSSVGKPKWFADRSRHVSKVIDFMFTRWEGHQRLIPNRVGVFGFSAGATTALIAVGGEPDLARVAVQCAKQREFVCEIMKPEGNAGSGQPQWVHDPRIAAAVLAAPGLGFAFAPSGLAHVRVPIQLWVGAADRTVPYETNAAVVRQQLAPRAVDFHRVEGAVHLSFLAPCGPATPPALCQDTAGFDRPAFHRELNAAMTAFFKTHLMPRADR
jgi:predicted dienelactone hydrolase